METTKHMETAKTIETKDIEPIQVIVRCRPLLPKEIQDQRESIVKVNENPGEVSVTRPKSSSSEEESKTFSFGHIFGSETSQNTIYNEIASPIVDSVLHGYNGTIFAYGQTGAGKTYTVQGKIDSEETKGIIPRAIEHIFNHLGSVPDKQFIVRVSFLEIYNEQVYDLLNRDSRSPLQIREKRELGVYVEGLLSLPVENVADTRQQLTRGNQTKAIRETNMSALSSRSHTIFSITVECCEIGPDGEPHVKIGKLNLVDLAGSERQRKTQVTGMGLQEASMINKSLTSLGNVISALADAKSRHVPYRDSKLTRILQDSLGGNTKSVIIANIGPADWNYEETICTLKFASYAKMVKNKPMRNEDLKNQEKSKAKLDEVQGEKITMKEGDENTTQNLEDKKKMIEAQKDLTDEEKQRLLADLASKEEEKVDNEEKVVSEMEHLKKKLEEKSLAEQKLTQKLEEQEAELRTFRTMHCELEEKNKIIEKLVHELHQAKTEIQDLHQAFCEERKVHQELVNGLHSQVKLKDSIPQQNSNK